MKNRIFKLLTLALALILIIGAAVITSAAEEGETTPTIISKNLEYGEKFSLMYAVDATTVAEGAVTLKIYAEQPTEASVALRTYTATATETITVGDKEYTAYVFITDGVAPKDIADEFYAQATDAQGKVGAAVKYSVVEYLLERLYGGYTLSSTQVELYNTALAYGTAAQNHFAAGDTVRIGDYKYVKVVDGTVNGVTGGMFLKGTTVTLSANSKGWQATTADGETVKLDGTTYTVEDNVLIETYERPIDLAYSYYDTQKALGEMCFDYSSYSYWNYASNNTGTSSRYKFLANHDLMSADLSSSAHAEIETFADGGRALKIGKGTSGDHRISQIQFANLNSADKNCFVFESDIQFNIEATNQITAAKQYFARISLLDTFGDRTQVNTNGYMPTKNDATTYFEFGGAFDTETGTWTNVGTSGFNVENGKWYKMTIEYYKAENTMNLYFDGYLISSVSGLDAGFVPVAGVIQLQGQAWGSSIYVDNTYVGTVDKSLAE